MFELIDQRTHSLHIQAHTLAIIPIILLDVLISEYITKILFTGVIYAANSTQISSYFPL